MSRSKSKDPGRGADQFTARARAAGYPARSVFKLEDADRKHGIVKPGHRVLDLGCAPGSWTRYAARRVGPKGSVVGVDLTPLPPFPEKNVRLITADVRELGTESLVEAPFDVVLSDMAPRTSGIKVTDQARSLELADTAVIMAGTVLRPGGTVFIKVFQGPDVDSWLNGLHDRFVKVVRVKPLASRVISPEIFVLGTGYRAPIPTRR